VRIRLSVSFHLKVAVVAVGVVLVAIWCTQPTTASEWLAAAIGESPARFVRTGEVSVGDDEAHRTQPPTVTFVAPVASMGDYGANHGNVWDMAEPEPTDIIKRQENFPVQRQPASQGTIVRGSTGSQVLGMAFWGSSSSEFPASQYHNLVYRLKIQAQSNCWTNGRAAYARSWPYWYGSTTSTFPYVPHISPMRCPYGTFCIYYVDLARNNNWPRWPTWHGATSVNDPSSWLSDPVKAVAVVPNEICVGPGMTPIGVPDYFDLDFVYLTGDILAREEDGYKYTVQYNLAAPDSAVVTTTIRYQEVHEMRLTGQQPTCSATNWGSTWRNFSPVARRVRVIRWFGSQPPPVQRGSYTIYLPLVDRTNIFEERYQLSFADDLRFTDGKSYYLCIQADDGISRSYRGSDTPVVRAPRSPWFGPDGD
jgi:hypothetical protein